MPSVHRDILETALEWLDEGTPVAMATVLKTWGSAPCPTGSILMVAQDGRFEGSVSGGCVEADVIRNAAQTLQDGQVRILEYGVADELAISVGLACGGKLQIRVDKTDPALLTALLKARRDRTPRLLLAEPQDGPWQVLDPQALPEALAAPTRRALLRAALCDRSGGNQTRFVRVFNPALRLIIVGAVHIAQILAPMARAIGFEVTLVDPREAFASPARFPDVARVHQWPGEALEALKVDARTAVVTLTHDTKLDDPALVAALRTEAFYIGALGSRRTQTKRQARLLDHGFAQDKIDRIHGPIGLNIGAQGPAEIAVSIIAQIVERLRLRPIEPIGAMVLAGGLSRRMGAVNKLLLDIDGQPMVRRSVQNALDSGVLSPIVVVTGHEREAVERALKGLNVTFAHNPDYQEGMGTSLRTGAAALQALGAPAAAVLLGDMPWIKPQTLAAQVRTFDKAPDGAICRPRHQTQPGHPVIFDGSFFTALSTLEGDTGARHIIQAHKDAVRWHTTDDPGILQDLDALPPSQPTSD